MNAKVFEQEMQKSYNLRSLWRSVGGIVVKMLKEDGEVWKIVGLWSAWRIVVDTNVHPAGSFWISEK